MKIAVCSQGDTLDSMADARFGRCAYFVIIDPGTKHHEVIKNPSLSAGHGAGVSTAQVLSDKGVTAVCTQNIGPHAHSALKAADITVFSIVGDKTVKEIIDEYEKGMLEEQTGANVTGQHQA
ncbi:MAG: NifB/NifX family molybdenum-iron cluster-binding protein [Bacillota bacterium]|jgi:predicted Fe-Mo cluster-binding NifX family protein